VRVIFSKGQGNTHFENQHNALKGLKSKTQIVVEMLSKSFYNKKAVTNFTL
jgi:hypothetical protein